MIITRLIIFIFIFILSIRSCFSLESGNKILTDSLSDQKRKINSLNSGIWSVQFTVSGNLDFTTLEGMTLSVKRNLSHKTALRFGLSGSYSYEKNNTDNLSYQKSNSESAIISYLYYLNPAAGINFYGLAGISISFYNQTSQNNSNIFELRKWTAGPFIGAGTEYFLFSKLSICAEYSYSLSIGNQKNTVTDSSYPAFESSESYSIVNLKPDFLKLGINYYF